MYNFTTAQDFFKPFTDAFAAYPKTVAESTAVLEKVKKIAKTEYANTQCVLETYQRVSSGDATPNEIALANKKSIELVKATTFASLLTIPGAIFFLPAIVKQAKSYNLDIVPESVATQFAI